MNRSISGAVTYMASFCKRWGWVLVFVLVAIVVIVLTAGKVRPDIGAEIQAAKAEADAEKLKAQYGREVAKRKIEEQYVETIRELDTKEREQEAKLKDDAAARAKFYARVAAKRA